ncbi:MAG: preprotein translocase subunit SecG [Candidatus Competibacteraceae bacterium]|nr:preprotein translocase subunit SecG [Candidatus Competibacteraceae bacterium]
MSIVFTILIFLCALLLILVVLIQNSKGGGLASNIGISNQLMGVKKTTDVVEKATWTLGIALVVLSIASAAVNPTKTIDEDAVNQSKIQEQIDEKALPVQNAPQNVNGAPLPNEEQPAPAEGQ